MSAELYSNGHGQYSLEQLPDFYPFDTDEIESNIQIIPFLPKETPTSFSRESKRPVDWRWTWQPLSPFFFPTADSGLSSLAPGPRRP
jgi:hypothetical protein